MSRIASRLILAIGVAAALLPATAFASEGGEGHGSWLMLVFFAINFALFVFILARFAAPSIRGFLQARAVGIRDTITKAETALSDAEAFARDAAQRAATLDQRIAQLKQELQTETERIMARLSDSARATAERIRHDAELTTAALIDSAQRRVRGNVASSAARLAREMITRSFGPADQRRLLDSFMLRLGQEARQ